jgi:hypothetical protein
MPKIAAIRAKYLIEKRFLVLPPKRATERSARRIKHLARLPAAFPQCYPQERWASLKRLLNHELNGHS